MRHFQCFTIKSNHPEGLICFQNPHFSSMSFILRLYIYMSSLTTSIGNIHIPHIRPSSPAKFKIATNIIKETILIIDRYCFKIIETRNLILPLLMLVVDPIT